jgi:biopolymer transport protein ExbD
VTNLPTTTKPENMLLSVDSNCDTYVGQTKVESKQELLDRAVKHLKDDIARQEALGGKIELPEAHIRGDKDMEYRCVGGVIYTLQRAGFLKLGFISEPVSGSVVRLTLRRHYPGGGVKTLRYGQTGVGLHVHFHGRHR